MIFPFIIPGLGTLALHAALALNGIPVVTEGYGCDLNPHQLGGFHTGTREVVVCENNLEPHGIIANEVIRHEAIHVIHTNLGYHDHPSDQTILSDKTLGFIVENTLSPEEIQTIILSYDPRIINQEFEARLGQRLPDGVVATGLVASQIIGVFQ